MLFFSLGLISSVLYWAGGWGLLDTYVLPDQVFVRLKISEPKYLDKIRIEDPISTSISMAQNNLLKNDCEQQAHFLSVTNVTSLTSIHEAHHQPLDYIKVKSDF